MSAPTIRVSGLSKRFRIGERVRYKSLRESIQNAVAAPFQRGRRPKETIWALRDVSFEVAPGEVVGVIGRNGAGKSTLLKVLSRITEPTEGRVELRGRVGSLLEVGTGFHLELTGRENIYLSGAILGMKRAEIVQRFDEIVAFAEVERFLDTPVKHYSTGMYLRLAFAVAAHLEPEILLVDEVLAVGDAEFQKKCLGKMKDVANSGRTVVFVSHDLAAIRQLVDRALLLDGGLLTMAGPPGEVIRSYLSASGGSPSDLRSRTDRKGSQIVRALELQIRAQGRETMGVATADDVVFELIYHSAAPSPLRGIKATLGIYDALGRAVTFLENTATMVDLTASPGQGSFRCKVPRLPLPAGRYYVNYHLDHRGDLLDWVQQATWFEVFGGDFFGTGKLTFTGLGGVFVPQVWDGTPSTAMNEPASIPGRNSKP